jgi:glyoxylase-like metal-dependent hydrolase (beta-lactamase superfamily II)
MIRRSFLQGLVPALAVATLPRWGQAAESSAPQLTVTPLTDRLFVICGGGGNVTVFNSPEGVLLVDGGSPEQSKPLLKLVEQRTGARRIHTLFNTHWHWDQTGSNPILGPAGTKIIAHENTRLWLSTDVLCKWQNDRVFKRLPPKAQPNETFYTTGTLSFGGEKIDYGYLPQAHTDGDIYVFFRNANVLVASDVVSVGSYPVIDYCTNGWIGGMVNATQTLMGLCNEQTRVVPGSGGVRSRSDVETEHAMLVATKQSLSHLLAQGMSAQDMIDAGATREFDAAWGDPKLFVRNVWPGLVQRARELGVAIV